MQKKLKGIVIAGATGVGKTDLSIKLAKQLNAVIISADASQVYKELNIGTAKITHEEMQGIPHYMIGGTGLYIKSITDGFAQLPSKDEKIRADLESRNIEELQEMLKRLDKKSYDEIDLSNKLRLVRAIEVCLLTGGKFSELRVQNVKNNSYEFLKIFLTRDRKELYERINKRVDIMISKGLVEEAHKIYTKYNKSCFKISSIGYKELFCYFDGKITLEKAIEEIKKESRRYAKRQMTWFKKEKNYITYNLSELTEDEVMKNIFEKWKKF